MRIQRPLVVSLTALFSLLGCASGPSYGYVPFGRVRDTATIHDAAANRVWLIHEGSVGDNYVILCDVQMLQQARSLCARWPEAAPPVAPAPAR